MGAKAMLAFGVALHIHHRFHGPPVDYVGLAAAAAASWAGIPGPGEPVLIAESVFAARHDLDISSVIAVAWLAAMAGGIVGWLAGLKAGRAVITARGPFQAARLKAVARGEQAFARHPVLAIYLTPSWVAGIHRPPAWTYLIVNALSCAVWAVGIGLGAYFIGPSVVDFVNDLGLITGLVLLAAVAAMIGTALMRRRRRGAS